MFEKVNPSHPDKLADRIAGALVDIAYSIEKDPRIAVEVLIGHEICTIIYESDVMIDEDDIHKAVSRITGYDPWEYVIDWNPQDDILSKNQDDGMRCGDNGIFRGKPITEEQSQLSFLAREIYSEYPYDGKYVIDRDSASVIICQSNADEKRLRNEYPDAKVNPLGHWTGGTDVDTGATNRKLGSDMGDAVTGGGLHGKDLSKADVSVNICCHLYAQETGVAHEAFCAIGDEQITFRSECGSAATVPYKKVVETARMYIDSIGGFEKLAEWGLV